MKGKRGALKGTKSAQRSAKRSGANQLIRRSLLSYRSDIRTDKVIGYSFSSNPLILVREWKENGKIFVISAAMLLKVVNFPMVRLFIGWSVGLSVIIS